MELYHTHTKWQLHALYMCMVLVITISIGCVHHVHYYSISVLHVNPNCPVLIVLPISTEHIWTSSCHYASTVEVDVKCMQANFGGRSLLGCRDFAPFSFAFKMDEISLQTMDNSPWGLKNRISSKNSCK